jgi:hypothetical protein
MRTSFSVVNSGTVEEPENLTISLEDIVKLKRKCVI